MELSILETVFGILIYTWLGLSIFAIIVFIYLLVIHEIEYRKQMNELKNRRE